MTRGIPSHPVLAAMLALALLVSVSAPVGAAPSTTVGAGDSVAITQSIVDLNTPGHHFGFDSVLAQVTAVQKLVTSVGGTVQPAGATTANVQPGQNVSFQVNLSGLTQNTGNVQVVDFFSTNLLFVGGDFCTAGAPAGVTVPAGNNAVTCNVPVSGTAGAATGSIALNFTVSTGSAQGSTLTNQACVVQGTTASPCATDTLTVSAALNNQLALQQAQATAGFTAGQTGVPCAQIPGQTCQVTGAVNGTGTVTASMTWNLTATAPNPAGVTAGTPIAVFTTTIGNEFIACTAVAAGAATTTCTGTTAGNALQGSSVAVVFPGAGGVALGIVTGPGALAPLVLPNLPLLPPPPLEFIPPPPPPLLPPPPPAPMGAMAAPRAAFPEVPVIPEADSLFLLVGGLVALGGLVGYRKLRRRDDA